MARKTWIPGLIRVMKEACRYINRWNLQLKEFIPPSAVPLLDAVVDACEALLEELEPA